MRVPFIARACLYLIALGVALDAIATHFIRIDDPGSEAVHLFVVLAFPALFVLGFAGVFAWRAYRDSKIPRIAFTFQGPEPPVGQAERAPASRGPIAGATWLRSPLALAGIACVLAALLAYVAFGDLANVLPYVCVILIGAGAILLVRARREPVNPPARYPECPTAADEVGYGPHWQHPPRALRLIFPGSPAFALACSVPLLAVLTAFLIQPPHIPMGIYVYLRTPVLTAAPVVAPQDALILRVKPKQRWYLNSVPVPVGEMPSVLARELMKRPLPWVVYVEGNRELSFRDVTAAIDVIKSVHAEPVIAPHP